LQQTARSGAQDLSFSTCAGTPARAFLCSQLRPAPPAHYCVEKFRRLALRIW
jgi:hypothetical protein